MPKIRSTHDDELDLYEFIGTLWDSKWLIIAFVALVTFAGFGYSQLAQPKHQVSVPYTFNIHSVSTLQICRSDIKCIKSEDNKRLSALLGGEWNSGGRLSLATNAPSEASQYMSEFDGYNETITDEIYEEAKAEITLIQTQLNETLLNTETVAANMLNAKRIIHAIDNGQKAIRFGSVSMRKVSPKVSLILASSAVLGGMIGVFLVLARNANHNRLRKKHE